MKFFYLIKIKIKHFISSQSNIWQEITAQRTNLKVCGVVVIKSAFHAEGLQFKPRQHWGKCLTKWSSFYLIKTKIKHFISSQSNIWYEFTARSTNRKVLWCNGYHFCVTRRWSAVQAWHHQENLGKLMFLLDSVWNHAFDFWSIQHLIWIYCSKH